MSDLITIDAMKHKSKTVPVSLRLTESDMAVVDSAAQGQRVPVSRSMMLTAIIHEWAAKEKKVGTVGKNT